MADQTLDARGLNCPLPILRTKKAISGMESGQILEVVATDAGSVKDMEAFCNQTGNTLEKVSHLNEEFIFTIIKA
jgi:tRNA 2-thiouridine synthesizing protein A